ncbi:hypothetical protein D3272_17910 [Lichenibacterium ramalinae]|uniref:Probable branched-chain-amino-acid aminotransferase n=2 Tax=Lichenibacterium ramalinae TaxID=2316527 RepID=A0A4Q2RAW8_9HYPH|nr:hypothetical protein D3272_17910 [Lichenibacterium ramalinae]
MPMDARQGTIWMDGRYVPWADARLHVLSHGLHYGTVAFEGVRVYDGVAFKLREHIERLFASCRTVGIELPGSATTLAAEAAAYVAKTGLRDAYLRPIAWRGAEELGIVGQMASSHLAMACWQWEGPHAGKQGRGIRVGIGRWRRPEPDMWPMQAKLSGLYGIGSINARLAKADGFDDALVLTPDGDHVAELTGANLFFVDRGRLVTPPTEHALNGLTRQTVIALAERVGLVVEVRPIARHEIEGFSGAFATGTAYEILNICQIGDVRFNIGSDDDATDIIATVARVYAAATHAIS